MKHYFLKHNPDKKFLANQRAREHALEVATNFTVHKFCKTTDTEENKFSDLLTRKVKREE